MALSAAGIRAFNELYRDIRRMAQRARVIIPPYPVARKRIERRAEQLNRLVAAGTSLSTLPLSFWSDVFGAAPAQDQPLLRSVQATMAKHGAVPECCQACGRAGSVLIDARADGSARGWLCHSCNSAVAACDDGVTLRKLAVYCQRQP